MSARRPGRGAAHPSTVTDGESTPVDGGSRHQSTALKGKAVGTGPAMQEGMSKRAQQQPPADPKNPPPNSIWGNKRTGAEAQVLRTEYDRARWRVHFWLEGTPEGAQQEMPRAQFLKAFALKGVSPAGDKEPEDVPHAPKGLPHKALLAMCNAYSGSKAEQSPAARAAEKSALARWVAWAEKQRLPCATHEEVLHAVNAFESELEDRGAQASTRKGYAAALHGFLLWHREWVAVRVPPAPRPAAHTVDSPRDMRLGPALARYIAEKGLCPHSPRLWEYCCLRGFGLWASESKAKTTPDLARQTVEVYLATLRADGHAENFAEIQRTTLSAFCEWWTGKVPVALSVLSQALLAARAVAGRLNELNIDRLASINEVESAARLKEARSSARNLVLMLAGVFTSPSPAPTDKEPMARANEGASVGHVAEAHTRLLRHLREKGCNDFEGAQELIYEMRTELMGKAERSRSSLAQVSLEVSKAQGALAPDAIARNAFYSLREARVALLNATAILAGVLS